MAWIKGRDLLMSERGTYGRAIVGADGAPRRSSHGTWIVGVVLVWGGVLWGKHQARQIERLNAAAALPHQSFGADLRERARDLAGSLTRRLGTRKEA
jgi:hypothetical protein